MDRRRREVTPIEPIHLKERDRFAFAYRVAGAVAGLTLVAAVFATSSWDNGWVIALFGLITAGGAVSYHLLTSLAACPKCGVGMSNFQISSAYAKRKLFICSNCGTKAYLTEGFYWQRDIAG